MNTPERGSLCAANEILEKTLLAELRLPYLHAHQIAPPFIAVATAFLSSDQSRALARRPTCCIPQPSSVMPSVPLRAGGLGPSDGNHAQAADADPLHLSRQPSLVAGGELSQREIVPGCPKNAL